METAQEVLDMGAYTEHLGKMRDAYSRVEQLEGDVKKRQKHWDTEIGKVRAEKHRLIESPVPGTTDERKKLIQQVQEHWQEEKHLIAGKKTEMADLKKDLREAKKRLKTIMEANPEQRDWVDEQTRAAAGDLDPESVMEHVDDDDDDEPDGAPGEDDDEGGDAD